MKALAACAFLLFRDEAMKKGTLPTIAARPVTIIMPAAAYDLSSSPSSTTLTISSSHLLSPIAVPTTVNAAPPPRSIKAAVFLVFTFLQVICLY